MLMNKTLAIIGSRCFDDYALLCAEADSLAPMAIVSGGAPGADSLARRYAQERAIPIREHLPDKRYGSPACFHIRNRLIIADSDVVLAFPRGAGRGTAAALALARRAGKPIIIR
jgi:predicted Rossmann fold nucleotide-binding protein DprA/Smf involved in DNA uptake